MVTNTKAKQIAEAVRGHIAEANQTVLAISEATGIPRPTLTRRLNGVTPFNVDELDRIAAHLSMSLLVLIRPEPEAAVA